MEENLLTISFSRPEIETKALLVHSATSHVKSLAEINVNDKTWYCLLDVCTKGMEEKTPTLL